jgi:hypothetical protein
MSIEGKAFRIRLVRVIVDNIGCLELAGKLALIQRARHLLAMNLGRHFRSWFRRVARFLPNKG